VQTDGVQPVSRIEIDSGDIGESSTRGIGFGYMESLERPFWPQDRIKNDKRSDGRIGIEGSDRTIFDKKCFPWGSYAPFTKIQRSQIYTDKSLCFFNPINPCSSVSQYSFRPRRLCER
jgi:hypothetical protein